jgi:hypothetical protein
VVARHGKRGKNRLKRKKGIGGGGGWDGSINTPNCIGLLILLQLFFYQKYPFLFRSYSPYVLTPISHNFLCHPTSICGMFFITKFVVE